MILEPIYEPRFYPHSYGFRPFRSAHHALARIHYLATAPRKYEWIVEGDIRDCFGSIDHGILLRMLRQVIHDRPLLHVMNAMLKAGVLDGLAYHESEGGSPQGSVVSPLWANIYLTALDRFVAAKYASQDLNLRRRVAFRGQTVPCDIVRYADDFVIMVRGSQQDAEQIKADVARFLKEELHMDLSLEKTLVTHISGGFDFLGYEVCAVDHGSKRVVFLRPSKKSKERFRTKVRDILRRMIRMPREEALIVTLNRLVRGWCLYFAQGSSASTFRGLERWLTSLVSKALYKKHRGRHHRSRKLHHREYWIPFRFGSRNEARWHKGAGLGVWLDVRRSRALHLWCPSHTRIVYTHQFGRYDTYDPADRALLLSRRLANRQRGRTERLGPKRQSRV